MAVVRALTEKAYILLPKVKPKLSQLARHLNLSRERVRQLPPKHSQIEWR